MKSRDILFIDLEVTTNSNVIHAIGASYKNEKYTGASVSAIRDIYFQYNPKFICGHNFINHDKRFLANTSFNPIFDQVRIIDTLFVSMLLYPDKLTHKLSKPYKTEAHIQNDPFGDCVATQNLLELMIDRFNSFDPKLKSTLATLLNTEDRFNGFFSLLGVTPEKINIYDFFKENIKSTRQRFDQLVNDHPCEMAILLVYLKTNNRTSLSYAVLQTFPNIVNILKELQYESSSINLISFANNEFGINEFREFEARDAGTDLFNMDAKKVSQLDIIQATLNGESILAILPTGGGKTFTFQMPALIKANAYKGLTIVISPLQALMKNHVDSFREKNQNFKVTAISGYLSPIERLNAIAEVENGTIDILYLAPEALRSNSIFNALKKRIIERFVIDEAHCFSSWGHDFRHDYKYIATFIKDLEESSAFQEPIPVSCFTATAKPEVIEDIKKYFHERLALTLIDYLASAKRSNLHYAAIEVSSDKEKYEVLVNEIIRMGQKPTIIYTPQNARLCRELSENLSQDDRITSMNLVIEPFYAMIDSEIEDGKRPGRRNKAEILNDFIDDKIDIVIATTAFGMGIDKPNIQSVIHYETSDSLESYLQESGRGGRSDSIEAFCTVLYSNNDFDKLFSRQNRSKIEYGEINRILKEIKKEKRNPVILSSKQLAEKAGIDTEDSSKDFDVMIKTALLELEEAGLIKRERNTTKIYATSINKDINTSTMEFVHKVLDPHKDILNLYEEMIRVMAAIIGRSKIDPIEVDDLADNTGVNRRVVHQVLYKLAEYELIAMDNDISAYITNSVKKEIEAHFEVENKLMEFLKSIPDFQHEVDLRDIHELRSEKTNNIALSRKFFQSLTHLSALAKKRFKVSFKKQIFHILDRADLSEVIDLAKTRQRVARCVIDTLLKVQKNTIDEVEFSSIKLQNSINRNEDISLESFHHTLVYLHETLKEFKLRRGRLIYYQGFALEKNPRIKEDNPYQKLRDYNQRLKIYYERKTESIHILKAFYKKISHERWALCEKFISDYFAMDYSAFKELYKFNSRLIKLPLTEERYRRIVENLNDEQSKIFKDTTNRAVMVLAGPGSGKTMTLVHKIASLITLENQKPEHFLMLTHGRAAAAEFRKRLSKLIGDLSYQVDIMTFHAYALQLLGKRVSDQNQLGQIIELATHQIEQGEIEIPYKTMLMLDEYQDVSVKTYQFIKALFMKMEANKRIIAVGDDDQCINNFPGIDSADLNLMRQFSLEFKDRMADENDYDYSGNATYSLLRNYRSKSNIVKFANFFAKTIPNRLKHNDLIAEDTSDGYIKIINYPFNTSVIKSIADSVSVDTSENIAVLCRTNQAVLTVYSMLKANGINVKYLTSKDGFKLGQLEELHYFLKKWQETTSDLAIEWLNTYYKNSTNLQLARKVIARFVNETNFESNSTEFLSKAFESYLYDIEFDEFESTKAKVIVSTMHKAKGKEFNSVYLMVENNFIQDDYQRRLLYVAITRAKENLYIHSQDSCFKTFEQYSSDVSTVDQINEEPKRILLSMGLGDLSLNSGAAIKGIAITKPIAGDVISIVKQYNEGGEAWFKLTKMGHTIGVLSKPIPGKDRLSATILNNERIGYSLDASAEIEYVVVRQDPVTKEETQQVLANITMVR